MEGGTYTITISGYPGDASFDQTTAEVTIASSGQTINRSFSGSWIRTASLMGMVTVEGEGLPGVTVAIAGRQDAQMLTDDNGQYTFTGLRAGNYTVEISGFDATDVAFSATSSAVEVAVGESKVWSFEGTYVRESTIAGQVSVEGNGLAGVTISLQGMGADESENTDMGGQFTFSNLRAGEYQLAISGFDTREYGFSTTSATVRVEHGRTANVPFEGIMLRTASIMGQVSVEGEGLADVTVSLSGEGESLSTMTDNSGQYAFSDLPAGNFQVGISGYDTDDYSFETTSKNVALALGETATVPFEGILLRTSGISGRVSVEGMGLDSVTVTLSHDDLDDDMTTMTDATGQYAFAGLAEGNDYTVAISGYDDVSYIFDNTSMDVDLGDDDTQIVNFMGMHARTASVTVKLFVDEGTKNDMMDEGEMMFPTPQILGMVAQLGLPLQLPITLAGPGVLDVQSGTPMADGSVVFANLRAGSYQVVVSDISADVLALLPPALATVLQDYSYGGPATGYPLAIAVGQEATQYAPVDITHQTVNFSVNLKSGEMMGAALPGATVSFFSDMAGATKIGDALTGADGMASLRIARSDPSEACDCTVYAKVTAPEGSYDTDGAMQAVMWDAQMTTHAASNSSDIVNTMADFSFSGATVTTDFGGGEALGGWKIRVTSGGDVVAAAPDTLNTDGSASFSETAAAGKTYKVSVAANQDDDLDGGENYSAGDGLEYTHDGLSLSGTTMDAGMLEVKYTTQMLKVYVHNERDQVRGYTGNVLGGDARMSGVLDVDIQYIDRTSKRARSFTKAEWDVSKKKKDSGGVVTFSNVPAEAQIIVTASVKDGQHVLLLNDEDKPVDEYELDAYTDNAENGRKDGGAFGDNGGYNHTVELCPLMSTTEQRHDKCGTFAFVNTYVVDGQVWENTVGSGANGTFGAVKKTAVSGISVTVTPVDGENLAGERDSYTSGTDNTSTTATKNTTGVPAGRHNEAIFFNERDWGRKAAGEYKLDLSPKSGWVARSGDPGTTTPVGDALSPLEGDLRIDVSPTTGYVYGIVEDSDGFRVEGATVDANGSAPVTTDAFGRYWIKGFYGKKIDDVSNRVRITASHADYATNNSTVIGFSMNNPTEVATITLMGERETATIEGTVRAGGDPVAGVEVKVNGVAPLNAATSGANKGKYVTGADGKYSVLINVGNGTAVVTVSKARMSFAPESHTVTVEDDAIRCCYDFSGFDHATISGRVLNENGGPMAGVTVTATPEAGGDAADEDVTDVRGVYSLSVPFGRYTVAASLQGYSFGGGENVNVGPGESKSLDDFEATRLSDDVSLSEVTVDGAAVTADANGNYAASVASDATTAEIAATATDADATVAISMADDADDADQSSPRTVDLTANETVVTVTVTAADGIATASHTVTVTKEPLSQDVSLSEVTVDGAAVTADANGNYAASVASDVTTAEIAATATHSDATVAISLAGDAADADQSSPRAVDLEEDGSTDVTVTVTAADGLATASYTVTVTNQSSDNMLSSLTVNGGAALVADADGNYATDVANNITTAEIAATAADANATVEISMMSDTAGTDQSSPRTVDLNVGENPVITVTVTPEDVNATASSATLTIIREHAVVTLSAPASVDEGAEATITASVDHAQAEAFTVTVGVAGDGTPGDNMELTYNPATNAFDGTVTVTAASNDTINDPALAITVSGSTDNTDVAAIDDVEIAVTDDESVASAPRNLQVHYVDTADPPVALADGSARLTWTYPANGGSAPITGYTYQATADGEPPVPATPTTADLATLDADNDGTYEVTLSGLQLGTEYTFSVHAESRMGDGMAAEADVEAQPGITMTLSGNTLNEDQSDTITVTIALTAASEKDVTVTVAVSDTAAGVSDTDAATVANASVTIPAGQTTVPATQDAPTIVAVQNDEDDGGTEVAFDVSATSDDARDPADQEVAITDDDTVSGAPQNLSAAVGNASSFVQWQAPADNGTSDIMHYEIRYAETADIDDAEWAEVSGGATAANMTISGLTNGTEYTVQVRAVTAAGNGTAASETVTPNAGD